MSARTSVTAPPVAAHHWDRPVILLLGVALAAMIALTVYLAATRTRATTGQTTSPTPPGTSQADPCFRQAVPC